VVVPVSDCISFRLLTRADLAQLGRWLDDPVVHRWWPDPHSPPELEADYGPAIDRTGETQVFVIELDEQPVGLAQRYRLRSEPEWAAILRAAMPQLDAAGSAGIDYLLGPPDVRGRGIGTRAIAAFSSALFADLPDIETIVVAVQQENRASWRALERCGYQQVWAGNLDSDDPSDAGPSYVLQLPRSWRVAWT
jgi:aminoglycoside 6'-N-acetyltransferase